MAIDLIFAANYMEYHPYALLITLLFAGLFCRNHIGRFMAIVIIDMVSWPLTYQYLPFEYSRMLGVYLTQYDMALIITFVLWVVKKKRLHHVLPSLDNKRRWLTLVFGLFAFSFVVAFTMGFMSGATFKEVFRDGKIMLIYFAYFPLRELFDEQELRHLYAALISLLIIGTATAFIVNFGGQRPFFDEEMVFSLRTSINKGSLYIDILVFPATVWAFIMAIYDKERWQLHLFLCLFFLLGVFLSISRAYLMGNILTLCFVAGIFLFSSQTLVYKKHRRRVVSWLLIALVVTITFLALMKNEYLLANMDRIGSMFGLGSGDTRFNTVSLTDRQVAVSEGIKIAIENPFGFGFGGYTGTDVMYTVSLDRLIYHSLPLALMSTFGSIGGISILSGWIIILFIALSAFRWSGASTSAGFAIIFSYILSQILIGFGGNTLLRTDTFLGIACAALEVLLKSHRTYAESPASKSFEALRYQNKQQR